MTMDTSVIRAMAEKVRETTQDASKRAKEGHLPLSDVVGILMNLKEMHDAFKDAAAKIHHSVDDLAIHTIPELMEKAEISSARFPEHGVTVSRATRYHASMKDREAAFDWLRTNGYGALIAESVHATKLTSVLKERLLEEGMDPPDDIFNFNSYNYAATRKSSKK